MFLTVEDEWLAIRSVSLQARGVLADLLYLISRGKDKKGTLELGEVVLRMVGVDKSEFDAYVKELVTCGVLTVADGFITSHRLERDQRIRAILTENGRKGGRPRKQP